jgi:DASH complex subunit ASK1
MIRQVGLDVKPKLVPHNTPGSRIQRSRNSLGGVPATGSAQDDSEDSFPAIGSQGLFNPNYGDSEYQGNAYLSSDDDSDIDDEINNTAHPSAAFLMASQRRVDDDDSFGDSSHSSDSIDDDLSGLPAGVIHPFAGATVEDDGLDSDDDSFDYQGSEVQEETVFGVPPAQRLQNAQAAAAAQQQGLRLMGEGLLDDTIGAQLVGGGLGVEETPTPAGWGGGGNSRGY